MKTLPPMILLAGRPWILMTHTGPHNEMACQSKGHHAMCPEGLSHMAGLANSAWHDGQHKEPTGDVWSSKIRSEHTTMLNVTHALRRV